MPIQSCLDQREFIENDTRDFGSFPELYPCWIVTKHGDRKRALFTYDQVAWAIKRAEQNPKTFEKSKKTKWDRLVDRIFRNEKTHE